MMHFARLLLLSFLVPCGAGAPAAPVSAQHPPESYRLKAQRLHGLYALLVSSSGKARQAYQRRFFQAFPSTFKELEGLYGNRLDAHQQHAPLYGEAEQHIAGLFNSLPRIDEATYYRKLIALAIGGHWEADAVNFFQNGLMNKVLANPGLVAALLQPLNKEQILSFWAFYFDEPYPKKALPVPLQKMKSLNSNVYHLMLKAQDEVLKNDVRMQQITH